MAVQHFIKFRSGTTPQQKDAAYRAVCRILADLNALRIPGIKPGGCKAGPPISGKGTRGYELGECSPAMARVWYRTDDVDGSSNAKHLHASVHVAVTVEFEDLKSFTDYIPHPHHRLFGDYLRSIADGTPLSYTFDTDAHTGIGRVGAKL
ncbi:hypothetical protein GGX14DRAFT_559438 [Mycena pura]|uniref:Stress-response A/B barrel domain-containing protein n=1 Tax=Mycena pura TaxID=153505 RepID=A0AAD6YGR6_9AGAR|nr:hypothetical protein GGX14DRAFT_559438 [Mycena pura]